jgi:hypothetical protein
MVRNPRLEMLLRKQRAKTGVSDPRWTARQYKSMDAALRPIRAFLRDPELLRDGEPLKYFGGMLPREFLGNWLICAASYAADPDSRLHFTTDPTGGDGLLYNTTTKQPYPTEHVVVPRVTDDGENRATEELIAAGVAHKLSKGREYARGMNLIVLIDGYQHRVEWNTGTAAQLLPPNDFASIWVAGRSDETADHVDFSVTRLAPVEPGLDMFFRVRITATGWQTTHLVPPALKPDEVLRSDALKLIASVEPATFEQNGVRKPF